MAPISFARGAPAPECLAPSLIAECAAAALERDGTAILSYGSGGGYGPLREWLAEQHGVAPGRVVVTTGGLQGFVFYAAELLARRPGRVLVEGPTYGRPLKVLAREGAEVVTLPMGEEGLDPDALERELGRRVPSRSSTRFRPSRTRAGGRSRRNGAGGWRSSSPRATSPCSRTIRTAGSATRARRRRACSSWRAASGSPTPRRSRRPSRRACASAGSCCPRRWPPRSRSAPSPPTSRRRSSPRPPCAS